MVLKEVYNIFISQWRASHQKSMFYDNTKKKFEFKYYFTFLIHNYVQKIFIKITNFVLF